MFGGHFKREPRESLLARNEITKTYLAEEKRKTAELEAEIENLKRAERIKQLGEEAHDELMRLRGEVQGLRIHQNPFAGFSNQRQGLAQ